MFSQRNNPYCDLLSTLGCKEKIFFLKNQTNNYNMKILGLDLGTNSIGWALVEIDHDNGFVKILGLGSRIIPMDSEEITEFESSGKIKSAAAQRTEKRGPRRLNERFLLRRDRLHLVLNLLDALPAHYKIEIDFERKGKKSGKFKPNKEPKLAYKPNSNGQGKFDFLFMDSYQEMLRDINNAYIRNEKCHRIPYDWTLYYLRQKALTQKISVEELAWVLLSYNQKRGYEKLEVEDTFSNEGEIIEELDLRVKDVLLKTDKEGKPYYEVHLDSIDNIIYQEYANKQMTFVNDLKEIIKTSKVDEQGNIDTQKTEYTVKDVYALTIEKVNYENEDGKHKYTITFDNGWKDIKQPKNFTFKYNNALGKTLDYIVETTYQANGEVKFIQGKDRRLREPDFGDNSKDWTLLKKRTEKEALKFNMDRGFKNEDGSIKNFISPKIYEILKNDAQSGNRTKIIGGMFQTIERQFYREELNQIIQTQSIFHSQFEDKTLFEKCVKTLYPQNEAHAKNLLAHTDAIQHLLIEDILLYQRPLKSKKSEIANCKYEIRYWKEVFDKGGKPITMVDEETGEVIPKKEPIYHKVAPASHPYFQEFRIWDKLHNLKLIQLEKEVNGKIQTNVDITEDFFVDHHAYQALFDVLNNQKSLDQEQFLEFCKKRFKLPYNKKESNYVWNFPEDEEIRGNETRVSFATRFKRRGFNDYANFLTQDKEIELWHYLYSVSYKDRKDNNNKSLETFFNRFLEGSGANEDVKAKLVEDFANYPKFPSKYCAYSEKALKKLLPFLRMGKEMFKGQFDIALYLDALGSIDYNKSKIKSLTCSESQKQRLYEALWKHSINERVIEILDRLNEVDFTSEEISFSYVVNNNAEIPFPKGLFNTFKTFKEREDFTTLDLTKASYLVYGRHSELAEAKQWISPEQIRKELHHELKQHSLNNPVAEKVVLEMMQIVADIWDYYGNGQEKFFNKIHLEVGRELKKSAKEKESITKNQRNNKAQNKRIRQVLEEFLVNSNYNANPRNSDHFERLKIVEEGAEHTKNIDKKFFEGKSFTKKEIEDILKKPAITKADFEKYKLWIEQGYRSPYTNKMIRLTDLFDGSKYNIDHVFPQASVTNNSLTNKVVCELEVNKLKSNQTGREFVNNPKQRNVYCSAHNVVVEIVSDATYVDIVKTQFSGTKRFVLLSREIPKDFTNSQMNNARHIARKAMEVLSHIVREKGEVEFRSKNVLPVTGEITNELKREWKLDEVWKELVAPRYKRMNGLTKSNLFGRERISKSGHAYFDCDLDETLREQDESYDIKRIDHRHHALDALIVALCTEEHVNYVNNINSNARADSYGKQKQIEKYRSTLKKKIMFSKPKKGNPEERDWFYMLPGEIRKLNVDDSERETVKEKTYSYKNLESFGNNYKKIILTALQHTIVTFKQNLRVINKAVNYYNNTKNKKKVVKQDTQNGNKYNWGIRRSLGKDTFYGKKLINGENKIVIRKDLDSSFNRSTIKTIADTGIQKVLRNHLKQFDTVLLPFDEAISYYDALLEKSEFEAITSNKENSFADSQHLIEHLRDNKYKFKKIDYSKLNVFIEQVSVRDFRNEKTAEGKNRFAIYEHPEIAFTPEMVSLMNQPENLKKLNDGKNHAPIKKVRVARGFGKQRPVSEDQSSVKSKQYVVANAGSNLYLGFYERQYKSNDGIEIRERKFEDIGLIELIEVLKQDKENRHHPLPIRIYDDKGNEFTRIFTLSQRDLVYVPTEEEINNSSSVDFNNLTCEQTNRIYKFVDGGRDKSGNYYANFVPYAVSKPIWRFHGEKNTKIYKSLSDNAKINIDEDELIQNEFGLGSQQDKHQNMIDGKTQIKKICWKLNMDRLGNFRDPDSKKTLPTGIVIVDKVQST
jgi:CRISPR-associated endonuclease Csn1